MADDRHGTAECGIALCHTGAGLSQSDEGGQDEYAVYPWLQLALADAGRGFFGQAL